MLGCLFLILADDQLLRSNQSFHNLSSILGELFQLVALQQNVDRDKAVVPGRTTSADCHYHQLGLTLPSLSEKMHRALSLHHSCSTPPSIKKLDE